MSNIDKINYASSSLQGSNECLGVEELRFALLRVFNQPTDLYTGPAELSRNTQFLAKNIFEQNNDDVRAISDDLTLSFKQYLTILVRSFGIFIALVLMSCEIRVRNYSDHSSNQQDSSKLYTDSKGEFNFDRYLLYRGKELDQFSYNKWTTNKSYLPAYLDMESKSVVFKPFSKYSGNWFPPRLGKVQKENVGTFFRKYTVFKTSPEEVDVIKSIVINSYDKSYGLVLSEEDIQVIPDSNKRIKAIRYTGSQTSVRVKRASFWRVDKEQEKVRVEAFKLKDDRIVDAQNNLLIPPSIYIDEGLFIPFEYIYNSNESKLKEKFGSLAGKWISPLDIEISQPFLDQVLHDKKRFTPKFRGASRNLYWNYFNSPIFRNMYFQDQFTVRVANQFRGKYKSKKHLMKAILKYVNNHKYIPDPDWEVARHTFDFILSGGGDCDDRALIIHNLASNFDISCGILGYSPKGKRWSNVGHAMAVCEYESKTMMGFDVDQNNNVTYVKGGRYKPMDYWGVGKMAIPMDFDKKFTLAFVNNGFVSLFGK